MPFLSAASWAGQGLHPRGNFEGFLQAAAQDKYLEAHGYNHWTTFYTDYGLDLQRRFFDHYLKGEPDVGRTASGAAAGAARRRAVRHSR